jgi:hypothetical protein
MIYIESTTSGPDEGFFSKLLDDSQRKPWLNKHRIQFTILWILRKLSTFTVALKEHRPKAMKWMLAILVGRVARNRVRIS